MRIQPVFAAQRRARFAVMIDSKLLAEIIGYLTAAADGGMSRNNSENLASELLAKIEEHESKGNQDHADAARYRKLRAIAVEHS